MITECIHTLAQKGSKIQSMKCGLRLFHMPFASVRIAINPFKKEKKSKIFGEVYEVTDSTTHY